MSISHAPEAPIRRFWVPSPFLCGSLSSSKLQEIFSALSLPPEDSLPPTFPDGAFQEWAESGEEWPRLLSPLLYLLGAAVAFWGCALLRLMVRLVSVVLAPLHR